MSAPASLLASAPPCSSESLKDPAHVRLKTADLFSRLAGTQLAWWTVVTAPAFAPLQLRRSFGWRATLTAE